MNENIGKLAKKLISSHSLTQDEYEILITQRTPDLTEELRRAALDLRHEYYGHGVFVRGLIEISSICKNDCLYCGIRCSNARAQRYRLTYEEILDSCQEGYALGFRTFVLQGGEDAYFTDTVLTDLIKEIKALYPDVALTLSLGERSYESYKLLKAAGADRYLLRHETASPEHYAALHPAKMKYENRMRCLHDLKSLGFQTGAGFMVGSPYQTARDLAGDLKFIEEFKPEMCGIGPFIPHKDTPFCQDPAGSVDLTCYLLSIIRIIHPTVLLPATTALGTLSADGRERGILSGANVVMPNLSPTSVREKYSLYDGKIHSGSESAQSLKELEERLNKIGYHIDYKRGDAINERK